jgi:hypothetical protein
VELAGFEAYPVGDGVRLEWHTLSEAKNLGFAVERRGETGEFEQIGFVDGAGTSVSPRGYEFFDTPPQGFVSYRLRQMDTDGAFSYSPVITVHAGRPERYDLSQPFPNPFNNRVSVRLNVPEDSFVTFEVINVRGEVVKTVHTGLLERGNHLLRWQGDTDSGFSAPSGLYFMRLRTPSGEEWRKIALVR